VHPVRFRGCLVGLEGPSPAAEKGETILRSIRGETDAQGGKSVLLARSRDGTPSYPCPWDGGRAAPSAPFGMASGFPERFILDVGFSHRRPRQDHTRGPEGGSEGVRPREGDRPRHERGFFGRSLPPRRAWSLRSFRS